MPRHSPVGRLDDIIEQLEKLHKDAQRIFDAHVDVLLCRYPHTSFGVMKAQKFAPPQARRWTTSPHSRLCGKKSRLPDYFNTRITQCNTSYDEGRKKSSP